LQRIEARKAISVILRLVEAIGGAYGGAAGRAYYERTSRPPHPHLIDVVAGTIVEIDHAGLEILLHQQARRLGYQLVDYCLQLLARPKL